MQLTKKGIHGKMLKSPSRWEIPMEAKISQMMNLVVTPVLYLSFCLLVFLPLKSLFCAASNSSSVGSWPDVVPLCFDSMEENIDSNCSFLWLRRWEMTATRSVSDCLFDLWKINSSSVQKQSRHINEQWATK